MANLHRGTRIGHLRRWWEDVGNRRLIRKASFPIAGIRGADRQDLAGIGWSRSMGTSHVKVRAAGLRQEVDSRNPRYPPFGRIDPPCEAVDTMNSRTVTVLIDGEAHEATAVDVNGVVTVVAVLADVVITVTGEEVDADAVDLVRLRSRQIRRRGA